MPRPTAILRQHLLTRSDLAKLEVPPGDILDWLGAGSLEPIASPDAVTSNDPIFTVSDRALRQRLAERLATVGKPTVVLSPLRVRSFLVRAMMQEHDQTAESAAADVELAAADQPAPLDAIAADDHAHYVAQVAAEESEQELAEAEAPILRDDEAAGLANETGEPPADEPPADEAGEEEGGWFDTDSLSSELDALELFRPREAEEPVPATTAPEAATEFVAPAESEPASTVEAVIESSPEPAPEPVQETEPEPAAEPEPEPEPTAQVATEPAAEPEPANDTTTTESMTSDEHPESVGEDLAAEPAASEPAAATQQPEPAPPPPPSPAGAAAAASIDGPRVETFLAEMQRALVDMANRPAPPPVDVQPIVAAVQAGFQQAAKSTVDTNAALASLGDRLANLATPREPQVVAPVGHPPSSAAITTEYVVVEGNRSAQVMLLVAFLLLCWSAVFWFKTGAPRLAIGTLVAANLAGCTVLLGRR